MTTLSSLKNFLKKGIGLSLLADIALSDEDDDLIKIPLIPEDQITFTVYYVYLKSATLSSEVKPYLISLNHMNRKNSNYQLPDS